MKLKKTFIGFAFLILLLYGTLIVSSFYFFKGNEFFEAITSKTTIFSVQISVLAASLAAFISIIIAIPAAYALSRYRFRFRTLIDVLLELPIIVSPAALGALILIFFNNPFGEWVQQHGVNFIYTFWGIVLAQFVTTLGIATRLVKASFDELPRRYEQVARTLGASHLKAFLTISLPLNRQGILAAFILTWAKAFGEFGATIMVAGTMAMKTETIPIAIFMKLSNADIGGSISLILILLFIGLFILYLTRLLAKNVPYA